MKNIIFRMFLPLLVLSSMGAKCQEVNKDYFDGQVYMKIKNNIAINFDTTTNEVNYRKLLPFLHNLTEKYQLTKVESSFHFSHSDVLKRTFRISFLQVNKVEELIKDLTALEQVEYAEKVPLMKIDLVPNDLSFNWGCLGLQYYLHDIHAPAAWDITTGSSSVVIAIVDNAVDINHEDLAPNVVSYYDVSDIDNNPNPPNSSFDHGTHCAGISNAKNNNNTGYASIGYNCGLMAIKATPNSGNSSFVYDGYEGITWAVDHGAKIISCSWGGSGSSTTDLAVINYADSLGALIVAAAGNDNNNALHYPSSYNHVISVASLDCDDSKSSFSNYGSTVDICTYGRDIYSTLPFNNYGSKNGTSMACPMVAGLCGLIWSKFPSYTAEEVEIALKGGAYNIYPDNPNYIGQLGTGRIDAYNSLYIPCYGSISLPNVSFETLKTESSGSINSASIIPSYAVVKLDAAISITLTPGFLANGGCKFNAFIDGCGGNR